MTEQSKPLERGATEYKRRHPDAATTQDNTSPSGSAAGRAAYARRHGTHTGRND